MQFSENNSEKRIFGDDGIEETLLPIPNRKVKLYSADGTAWETVWESRTLPSYKENRNSYSLFLYKFCYGTKNKYLRHFFTNKNMYNNR